jgi:hypothetical protein
MVQSFRPDEIVLYLCEDEFHGMALPGSLIHLTHYGLTIRFVSDNIRQYLKLIPALREFPDAVIMTADDDVFYHSGCLAGLMRSYRRIPSAAHANRARLVAVDVSGALTAESVMEWGMFRGRTRPQEPSPLLFPEGVAGTLWPAGIFYKDISNATLFLDLAPLHDDLSYWAMMVANGKKALLIDDYMRPTYIQGISKVRELWKVNCLQGADKIQHRRVFARYVNRSLAEERRRRSAWYSMVSY